jgi:pyridoxamine 5'-phosphate oxidase
MTLIDQLHANPLVQLKHWFDEAVAKKLPEANAMALATATSEGRPSLRIVLCKSIDEDAVVFFTNYNSRKGQELIQNPWAALAFHWPELGRQIRLEGHVERASRQASESYFHSRPRGSQIGAWASEQSKRIENYSDLTKRYSDLEAEFAGKDIPCPPHWGGFRLVPDVCEFWLSMPSRLHDRIMYRPVVNGWTKEQVSP